MRGGRAERVYLELRRAIEAGEYPVGAPLPSQPTLARRLGVSTVTLRAALERLRSEGLVEARHGAGTFVTARRSNRGAVLVVDDDPAMRALLADALAALGYEPQLAASGAEALAAVARRHFSHVLLDVRMPGLSGTETAARIARLDPRTVVVFVTGFPADTLAPPARPRWPLLILRKPFDLDDLERALRVQIA